MLNYDTKSWSKEIQEHNLSKSGYKRNMKYKKSSIIFLYFGYTLKTKYNKTGDFYYFFGLTSGDWKHPKNTSFSFLFFSFWRNFAPPTPKKKAT